jgi:hypothetical protein
VIERESRHHNAGIRITELEESGRPLFLLLLALRCDGVGSKRGTERTV